MGIFPSFTEYSGLSRNNAITEWQLKIYHYNMRNVATILFAFAFAALISCNEISIEPGTPVCIENRIVGFSKTSICDDAHVSEYIFQGKTVYVFSPGNTCGADLTSEVVDSDCLSLGYLGGISGNTKINGANFSNAMFVRTVWRK